MKPLLRTLAIVAFLALMTQTIRHAYLLWLEPRGSVLDRYDRPLNQEITSATSIDELLSRYDKVHKEAEEARKEAEKSGKELTYMMEAQSEPFKSEKALRDAINEWEDRGREIRQLRFYWSIGFVFIVLGVVAYSRFNRWLGVVLIIAAFSEFIYWTSPTFLGAGTREFERLLVNKFVFSLMSLILLMAVIWLWHVFQEDEQALAN